MTLIELQESFPPGSAPNKLIEQFIENGYFDFHLPGNRKPIVLDFFRSFPSLRSLASRYGLSAARVSKLLNQKAGSMGDFMFKHQARLTQLYTLSLKSIDAQQQLQQLCYQLLTSHLRTFNQSGSPTPVTLFEPGRVSEKLKYALLKAGILTPEDLGKYTRNEILEASPLGEKLMAELEELMQEKGFSFKIDPFLDWMTKWEASPILKRLFLKLGIKSPEDMEQYALSDFLSVPYHGKRAGEELKQLISKHGIVLRGKQSEEEAA